MMRAAASREELEAALRSIEKKALKYPGPWLTTWYAARKQLALMAEDCPDEECVNGLLDEANTVIHPLCRGSGKVYPQETVETVAEAIYGGGWDQISEEIKFLLRSKAVAVLDALGECE